MSPLPTIRFSTAATPAKNTVVVFCDDRINLGKTATGLNNDGMVSKAVKATKFTGAFAKTLDIITPADTNLDRVLVVGMGKISELTEHHWLRLGGVLSSKLSGSGKAAVMLEMPGGSDGQSENVTSVQAADMALGLRLGAYRFDRYKTKAAKDSSKKPDDKKLSVVFHNKSAASMKKQWLLHEGVGQGVMLARDLVNEPANILTPKEFARRASELKKLGCQVEILDEKAMKTLKMEALLGGCPWFP